MANYTKQNQLYTKIVKLFFILIFSLCFTISKSQSNLERIELHENQLKRADSLIEIKEYKKALNIYKNISSNNYLKLPIQKHSTIFNINDYDTLSFFNHYDFEKAILSVENFDIIYFLATQDGAPLWYIQKAIDLFGDKKKELYCYRGIYYYFSNNYKKSITDFEYGLNSNCLNSEYYYYLSNMYLDFGDLEKANTFINKYNNLNPTNQSGLILKAEIIYQYYSTLDCLKFVDSILQISSNWFDIYANNRIISILHQIKELCNLRLNEFEVEPDLTNSWCQFNNKKYTEDAFLFKANLYYNTQNYQKAINVENPYSRIKDIHFLSASGKLLKSKIFIGQNKIDSALIILDSLNLKYSSNFNPSFYRQILELEFDANLKANNMEKCFQISEKLLEYFPKYYKSYEKKGILFYSLGDFNYSKSIFEKSISLNKFAANSNYYLGVLAFEKLDNNLGEYYFKIALEGGDIEKEIRIEIINKLKN